MEKVWRPFSVWERRPVTPLNGATSGCFRKNFAVFVNKCKTGNSIPFKRQHFGAQCFPETVTRTENPFKNIKISLDHKNWHTLRLSPCKTAI
ncbi:MULTISPECIES: hypothetical protein [unclassified Marinobacter]|jgi:hypothetical protein|uniref:hypothetical protein n=1 Tax=unclassified Marinobacter TaxID=83889 RepID=UPI00114028B3|nr:MULTISPECIES: hypothetical protein [unclassified Marinobacter]